MQETYFVVRERFRETDGRRSFITREMIQIMIQHGKFQMGQLAITISSELASTEILLCLDSQEYPISGFPRLLQHGDVRRGNAFLSTGHGLDCAV